MMTYVTAFIFYTLAMIGILLIGFVVYKKTFMNDKANGKGLIKVLDTLPIGNKKMLHVIKVKNENFLIATNADDTTFLSKLNFENSSKKVKNEEKEELKPIKAEKSVLDEIYTNNNFQPNNEIRFDDPQRTRSLEIQKQFKELYEKEELSQEALNKKEMMQKLLANYKSGSKF